MHDKSSMWTQFEALNQIIVVLNTIDIDNSVCNRFAYQIPQLPPLSPPLTPRDTYTFHLHIYPKAQQELVLHFYAIQIKNA